MIETPQQSAARLTASLGKLANVYEYSAEGEPVFWNLRIVKADGSKTFRMMTADAGGYQLKRPEELRPEAGWPLYGLHSLATPAECGSWKARKTLTRSMRLDGRLIADDTPALTPYIGSIKEQKDALLEIGVKRDAMFYEWIAANCLLSRRVSGNLQRLWLSYEACWKLNGLQAVWTDFERLMRLEFHIEKGFATGICLMRDAPIPEKQLNRDGKGIA